MNVVGRLFLLGERIQRIHQQRAILELSRRVSLQFAFPNNLWHRQVFELLKWTSEHVCLTANHIEGIREVIELYQALVDGEFRVQVSVAFVQFVRLFRNKGSHSDVMRHKALRCWQMWLLQYKINTRFQRHKELFHCFNKNVSTQLFPELIEMRILYSRVWLSTSSQLLLWLLKWEILVQPALKGVWKVFTHSAKSHF